MSDYQYHTIGTVAALQKCIIDEFGEAALEYERWEFKRPTFHFEAAIGGRDWTDFAPSVETESASMQHFAWADFDRRLRYDIWLGAAHKARALAWHTRGDDANH